MISGDEHMAARLGLMGLGLGPAQASPPHERVRMDMRDEGSWCAVGCGGVGGGAGSRGEGERQKKRG